MSSRVITYVWKTARPKNEGLATALMAAAYKTALETDSNATQILTRSRIHSSTFIQGAHVKDGPHITIAINTQDTERDHSHQASHGYTSGQQSCNVVKVSVSSHIKKDTVKNVWPQGLQAELVQGEPAVLADQFIVWDSE